MTSTNEYPAGETPAAAEPQQDPTAVPVVDDGDQAEADQAEPEQAQPEQTAP